MPRKAKNPGENSQGPKTTNQYTTIAPEGVTYLTVRKFSIRFDMPESTVRRKCANKELPGAMKFGRLWRIPVKEEDLPC